MDVSTATSLISTVGFPIVACIYMAYLVHEMTKSHKEEMDSIKDALNGNTSAIGRLETLINTVLSTINNG